MIMSKSMLMKNSRQILVSLRCLFTSITNIAKDDSRRILKLVSNLDKKGLVIKLDNKDIQKNFSAGSSKGGQKANKAHNLVTLRHLPTGIKSEGKDFRLQPENLKLALANLRMAVDIHVKQEQSAFVIIRKEEEEKARKKAELKKIEAQRKLQNEMKLKALLLEEDNLKY